jgi:hypothetical protein
MHQRAYLSDFQPIHERHRAEHKIGPHTHGPTMRRMQVLLPLGAAPLRGVAHEGAPIDVGGTLPSSGDGVGISTLPSVAGGGTLPSSGGDTLPSGAGEAARCRRAVATRCRRAREAARMCPAG